MAVSYGIDLGGYSTGTSRVVRAEGTGTGGVVKAHLVQSSWSESVDGSSPVQAYRKRIDSEMSKWEPSSSIVVDVPLDLQGLPHVVGHAPAFHWQLTQRPIDYALSGLPPLADRIGAAVARWRALSPFSAEQLGSRLFETYPAGSLLLSGYASEGYKRSEVCRLEGKWVGRTPKHRSEAKRDWNPQHPLARIMEGLHVRATEKFLCNDDDVDALLCALVGLPGLHVVEWESLREYVMGEATRQRRPLHSDWKTPQGYRLLDFRSAVWDEIDLV
jgi:hypothetical protein